MLLLSAKKKIQKVREDKNTLGYYLSERDISILHGFCLHGSPSSWTGRDAVDVRVTLIP